MIVFVVVAPDEAAYEQSQKRGSRKVMTHPCSFTYAA